MSDQLFPVPEAWAKSAWVDNDKYLKMYEQSVKDPEGFWGEQAKRLDWFKPWTKVKESSFEGDVRIKWFIDGKLNVSYNCLDRHLAKRGDQVAIIWEADDPAVSKSFTYRQLHQEVCKFANVLKSLGLKPGGPGNHLSAHDPRAGGGHAGVHPHWRYPLHRVRRFFTGFPGGTHPGLPGQGSDHRG